MAIQPTLSSNLQPNELVIAADFTTDKKANRNRTGNALAALLGIETAIPMRNPFTVIASGGMNVAAGGGGGQMLYIASPDGPRLVDSVPTLAQAVPAATSQPRNDLLCALYTVGSVANGTRSSKTSAGVTSTISITSDTESVTYAYKQGTPSATPVDPTPDTGYVALARISVAANATSITQSNITIIPLSMQSQILSGIMGYVDTTTDQPAIGGAKSFTQIVTSGVAHTPTSGGFRFASISSKQGASGLTHITSTAGTISGVKGALMAIADFGNPIVHTLDEFGNAAWVGALTSQGITTSFITASANGAIGGSLAIGPGANPATMVPGDLLLSQGNGIGALRLGDITHYLAFDGRAYQLTLGDLYLTGGSLHANGTIIGSAVPILFPSRYSTNARAQIYSSGQQTAGVTGEVIAMALEGVGQYLALDSAGNFGVQSSLFVGNDIRIGQNGPAAFYLQNPGRASGPALAFGNTSGSNTSTEIGSNGGTVSNVSATLLSVANRSIGTFFALDANGNLGIPGVLHASTLAVNRGAVFYNQSVPYTSNGTATTINQQFPDLALPTLPGPSSLNYQIIAAFSMGDMTSRADGGQGYMTLQGLNANWFNGGSITQFDATFQTTQKIQLTGTAQGGSTPVIRLTVNSGLDKPYEMGVLTITAYAAG